MIEVHDSAKVNSAALALTYTKLSVAFVITASYLFGCDPISDAATLFGNSLKSALITPVQKIGQVAIERNGRDFLVFTEDGSPKGQIIYRESLTRDTELALDRFFTDEKQLSTGQVQEMLDLKDEALSD